MVLQLSSVPNLIRARAWSTNFLAGGGGTTTVGTFSYMIRMVNGTGVNIIILVSYKFVT